MGGKTGTTTQQSSVSIPPEVLARYNAVNTRAENVANQQFTPYTGEFVAPLTGTQQAGISNINQAQGMATPYYDAAGSAMYNSYQGAQPYYGAATGSMQSGQQNANLLQGEAYQGINQAYAGAQPYQQTATQGVTQAYAGAQPYQQAATQGLAQAYAGAQPYQGIATNLGLSGANAVNPDALTGQNINQYMSPYLNSVVGSTMANLRQQQQQEQSQILGDQIKSGAFGGDRGRIAQANLARQQELASGQTVAGLMNQGYGQALTTAQQQQAQQLSAEQANRAARASAGQQMAAIGQQGFGQGVTNAQQLAALGQQGFGQGMTTAQQLAAIGQQGFGQGMTTAQQLAAIGQQGFGQGMTVAEKQAALGQQAFGQGTEAAKTYQGLGQGLYGMGQEYGKNVAGLGTQAQQTALQGAQAQLGAGTLQQQTQQALNTANYNQFLQQQGYPFQVAQFLANIAMGTGALSGTSQQGTTTSPQSFFSDRRLKDDIEKIGKTFDGQDIVRYKYKGEPGTRIGLIAQDVEKHHPEAVGLAGGYRTVDYDKATDDAAERGHFASGGLAGGYSSEGGAVLPEMSGMGFASGGAPDINSMMAEILNAHQGMYPYGKAGLYGQTSGRSGAYGTSQMQTPTRGLMRVDPSAFVRPVEHQGAGQQAMQGLNNARAIGSAYTDANSFLFGTAPNKDNPEGTRGTFGNAGNPSISQGRVARLFERDTPPTPPQANTPAPANTPSAQPAQPADRRPEEVVTPEVTNTPIVEATGGLVRGHYAMGGLPFSEAGGYIPEGVLNDDERDKNKKAMDSFTPKPAGAGQSGSGSGPGLLGGLGQIGGAIGGAKALGSAGSSLGSLFGGAGEAAAGASEAAAGATAAAEAASAANMAAGSAEGFGSLLAMLPMMAASDRRLKDDIEKIGKTFDGQDIVRYRYKGEPATQIGLIAQDVEKHHPDAVGLAGGYRTVDYRKATEDAADRGHFAGGGLAGVRHGYQTAGTVVGTDPAVAPPVDGLVIPPEELDARMTRRMVTSGLVPPPQNAPHLDPYASDRAGTAQLESGNRNVRNPNPNSSASGPLQITNRLWNDIAPSLNLSNNLRDDPTAQGQVYNAVRSRAEGQNGPMTGPQFNGAWFLGTGGYNALKNADPNANAYEVLQSAAPRDVEAMFGNNSTILNRNMTAAQALEAAITRRGPEGGNTQSAGLAGAQNASTGLAQGQYPRATQDQPITPSQQLAREVLAASREQRASPNWMQRNQDWLVPLLSGVGAMASSPSRYLGAALLQGIGGGAQQYASMQNKAEEQNVARQRLTTEQLGAVNQAGQLDVARLRQETEDRRIGLQLYNNWRQNFRQVTLERPGPDGRPVPTQIMQNSQTGAEMTPAQFAQEEARILREYGLTRGQTTTGAVVAAPQAAAPAGQGQGTPTPAGQSQGTPTPAGQSQSTAPPAGQSQGTAPPVTAPPNAAAAPQGQPASTSAAPQGQNAEGQQPPAVPQGQPAATAAQAGHQQLVNTRLEEIHAAEVARDRARENLRVADANNAGNVQSLRDSFTIAENQVRHLTEKTYALDNGVQYRILPGSVINANPPEPLQPNSARIDPNTAMVQASPVDIGYSSTGGFALPPGTPTQGIQIVSNPREQAVREQSARNAQEFINATQRSEENIPNILRFATALKVLDATGLNSSRADIAQTLRGLGLEAVANSVLSEPNTSAALTAAKTQVYSAIQAASAAFPRTTQSEFGIVNTQGTPNANMTPDAAHQLTAPQLALAMSETQLRQAWQEASNRGVQNFDAFADRWRRQNPPRVFLDSANSLLGNFRGQNLPNQFTQGVLYVMPTDRRQYANAPANLRAEYRPGQMFVVRNVQTNPETRRQSVTADPIESNVNAFDVYRQAPGFQLYGVR